MTKAETGQGNPSGGILRRTLVDPVLWALVALTVPAAVCGVLRTAASPDDHGFLTAFLLMGSATVPAAWSVLNVIWREPATAAILIALLRTVLVPLLVPWPPAAAAAVTVHLPAVRASIEATRREDGWRYFFGADDGSLLQQSLGLGGMAGLLFAMITALGLSVFVVLPVLAWFRPVEAAQSNMLETESAEDRAAATASIRMLAVIVMMTFGIPTLIVVGSQEAYARDPLEALGNALRFFVDPGFYYGDLMWALGLLAIPFGIFLLFRLKAVQRPDVARRARFGVNARDDHDAWLEERRTAGSGDSTRSEAGEPHTGGDVPSRGDSDARDEGMRDEDRGPTPSERDR